MAFHSFNVDCVSGTHRITHPNTVPIPFYKATIAASDDNTGYIVISSQDNQGVGIELRAGDSVDMDPGDFSAVYYTADNAGTTLEIFYWD